MNNVVDYKRRSSYLYRYSCKAIIKACVAELVDAADLKSVDRKVVPVRFRPRAPYIHSQSFAVVHKYRISNNHDNKFC